MRAACYCRSSKDRSDVSIDAQRRQLLEMAVARGYKVVADYSDAVESAKDDDRPAFQTMLRELRNPQRGWDTILVLDTARIARRRHLSIIFEEHECKRAGVKVIYKSLPESDPITEMLLKSILQAMDEWHSLTSKAKGLAGMAENVRQGYRAGGSAPKGYRLESIATGTMREGQPVTKSKLVLGDDAMLVRAYLQARARGTPRARALQIIGQDWPVTTMIYIDRNALTYAGHTVWNRLAERPEKGGYVAGGKYRPRDEWVIHRDTHEALITDEEAETILAAIETKSGNYRDKPSAGTYLLTGLLVSPDGKRWHVDGEGFYRLGKGKRIKAAEVDRAVMECVQNDIASDPFAKAVLAHYQSIAQPENRSKQAAKIAARIAELDKQTHRLADLLSKTTAPDALMRSIETMESERRSLAQQLETQKADEALNASLRSLTLTQVKTFLGNIDLGSSPELIKDALTGIVDSVTLDPATFEARIQYKVTNITGDKLASPRRAELIPGSSVLIQHRRRA